MGGGLREKEAARQTSPVGAKNINSKEKYGSDLSFGY